MKLKILLALLAALVLAGVFVSCAVAGSGENFIPDENSVSVNDVSPASGIATVVAIQWWKNGIKQPTIIPVESWYYSDITVNTGDTLTFKVKCKYSGPGNGYMFFREANSGYQETMSLRSGVISTKTVARSFMWMDVSGSDPYRLWVNAYPNGQGFYGSSGYRYNIHVYVV